MPRISALTLDQVNRQFDALNNLQSQVTTAQQQVSFLQQQVAIADPIHAPSTTNNITFTWDGGSGTVNWTQGFIKDKNWDSQTVASPTIKSSVKGQQHAYTVPAGSLSLLPSTAYWFGWNHPQQTMLATTDASTLHSNYNTHLLGQIFTGTTGQSGVAGGGGNTGGTDVSGLSYNNFSTSNAIQGTVAGLLLQAGTTTGTSVVFPTAYPSTPAITIGNYGGSANIASSSATGFTINPSSGGQQIDWIAVGPM